MCVCLLLTISSILLDVWLLNLLISIDRLIASLHYVTPHKVVADIVYANRIERRTEFMKRSSVCPVTLPRPRRAAGLLLSAVRARDIDRQQRASALHGDQQQMRAVSRPHPT